MITPEETVMDIEALHADLALDAEWNLICDELRDAAIEAIDAAGEDAL